MLKLIPSLRPGQLDLLVLPEMALSGYMFSSPDEAAPYLETPRSGPTAVLATSLAERLRCHVIAGYPEASGEEKVQANGSSEPNGSNGANGVVTATGLNGSAVTAAETAAVTNSSEPAAADKKPVGYNSAVLASPAGEVIGNYRKTFLFETDKNWAREGDGFSYFDLPEPLGRVAIGICMGASLLFDFLLTSRSQSQRLYW